MNKVILLFCLSVFSFSSIRGQWIDISPQDFIAGNGRNVDFINADTGFLVCLDASKAKSFLYRTNNAGKDWFSIYETPDLVDFINDSVGFLFSGRWYHKTINGGDSFYRIKTFDGSGGGALYKNQNNDLFVSVISGKDSISATYKSSDLGENWYKVSDSTIRNISFIDPHIGFGVFLEEDVSTTETIKILMKTIDGGESWQIVKDMELELESSIVKMQFLTQDTGYISVYEPKPSVLMRTINGGMHWDTIYSTDVTWIPDFHFFTSERALVHGGVGLFKTNNAGYSWLKEPGGNPFTKMQVLTLDKIYAFGFNTGSHTYVYKNTYNYSSWDYINTLDQIKEQAFEFKLWPNPASKSVKISWSANKAEQSEICIRDAYSRILYQSGKVESGQNTIEINVGHLPKGLYIVELKNKEHSYSKKFVLQ